MWAQASAARNRIRRFMRASVAQANSEKPVSKAPMRRAVIAALVLTAACGSKKIATVDPAIAARESLARADANLRAGCFDCLTEALREYESVRTVSAVSGAA